MKTLIMGLLLIAGSASASSSSLDSIVGSLKPSANSIGCYFIDGQKAFLFADYGSSGTAKISGKEVPVSVLLSDAMNASKPGDKVTEKFKTGNVSFDYSGKLIAKCAPEGKPCDESRGTLTIASGKMKEAHEVTERCGKFADGAR